MLCYDNRTIISLYPHVNTRDIQLYILPNIINEEMDDLEVTMWSQWKVTNCGNAKNYLFQKYQQWALLEASYLRGRLPNLTADKEDFYQYAIVGLLEALNSFEVSRGVLFKSYAQYRIRGSILNHVFKYSDETAYKNKIFQTTLDETSKVDQLIEINGLIGAIEELAIEHLLTDKIEESSSSRLNGYYYSSEEMQRLKADCNDAVLKLEEPKQTIIFVYYRSDKSLKEISELLDLSLGRVSQLKKEALKELMTILEKNK